VTFFSLQCLTSVHLRVTRPRNLSVQFLIPPENSPLPSLASDMLILLISASVQVTPLFENYLRTIVASGVPPESVRVVVHSLPDSASAAAGARKSLLSYIKHFFPDVKRLWEAENKDALLRSLAEGNVKDVVWRRNRARLLAEEMAWQDDGDVLTITGVVRGARLSANRLIHLAGVGDFQIDKV
jgi:pre-rRNA-processing protein TSR1